MGVFDKLKRLFGGDSRQEAAAAADERIAEFWRFWAEHRDGFAAVVGRERPSDAQIEALSRAVAAIHGDLDWEFGPGERAPHAFTLSGHGDSTLRILAERWKAEAPDDPTFDFFTTRQPGSREAMMDYAIGWEGEDLSFADLRLSLELDEARRVVHVQAFHPRFGALSEDSRLRALFIMLDQAIGEDRVERWVGSIEAMTEPLAGDAVDLNGLWDAVEAVAKMPEDRWVVAEGEEDGVPFVYMLNLAIKRWDYPLFDTFCRIKIPYPDTETGFPDDETSEALDELQDGLVDWIGASAVCVGRGTGGCERHVYFYVDGASDTAERLLAWTRGCGREARLEVSEDPSWSKRP